MSEPVCRRCGGSCEGLRVRVGDGERSRLARQAESLGVARPFSGPYLRQVWGRCVFLDASGCRLHAAFGAGAKPEVCRIFPRLPGGDVDPACFHAPDGQAELAALDELTHGASVRARLDRLPLVSVLDGPHLGPITTGLLRGLVDAGPVAPVGAARALLARRIDVAVRHGFGDLSTLVGGAQLVVGAGLDVGAGFAAWTRLVRTGALDG